MNTTIDRVRKGALVFGAMFLMELMSTFWILSVAEKQALYAAIMASLLEGTRALAVVAYVKDSRLVAPLMAGSFIGTLLAVWLAK